MQSMSVEKDSTGVKSRVPTCFPLGRAFFYPLLSTKGM